MADLRIRKSILCYRTELNESEVAWKNVVDNSLDTIILSETNLKDFLYCDHDVYELKELKTIECFNKKCSSQINYPDNVVVIRCNACLYPNCMECLATHEIGCSKQGKPDESINVEEKNKSTQEANEKIQLATNEMKTHNYVSALIYYTEAISLQPDNARFLCERCKCLMALGYFESAIDDATRAISLDPNYQMSYHAVMDCYLTMGDLIKLENLIAQRKSVASEVESVDKSHEQKLIELKKIQGDINDFLLCSNYEKILECIDSALEISTACADLHLIKMGLHVILKRPVTEKMLESTTNKYIERVCGVNFFDLLQLFYNDNLPLCMTTAARMLELLPKKISAIADILDRSRRFIEDFEKAEQLCSNKKFSESANILRDLLTVDPSNKAVAERILSKLAAIERLMSNKNFGYSNEENEEYKPEQSTKYSFTTSEITDNRIFFDKFYRDTNSNHEVPNTEIPSTRYSFSASDIKYSKEDIGKSNVNQPKPTWASLQAESKNQEGCKVFCNGNYIQAHKLYGQAIYLCPNNPKYLTNRSTCSVKLNNFKDALADALKSVVIDKGHVKGYFKAIGIFIILGEISSADRYIDILKDNFDRNNVMQFSEIPKLNKLKEDRAKIDEFYAEQNYQECLKYLNNAMKIATHCENFENLKAECLVMVKQYDEADAMIDAGLKKNPKSSYLIFVQGLKHYYEANLDHSIVRFKQSLRCDPDLTRASKFRLKANQLLRYISEGIRAFNQKQYDDARAMFSKALNVDTTNTKMNCELFYYRATTNHYLRDYKEAYADYTEALKINNGLDAALSGRAFSHYHLNELEDCLIDCEELLKLESHKNRNVIANLAENAKLQLRQKKPRNNFSILGIPLNATIDEIKTAFRKLSLLYHSDKNPNATFIDQRKLRRRFQEIKVAYDSLRQSYFF